MKKLALIICFAFSCEQPPPDAPPKFGNVELSCGSTSYRVATCVGRGKIYKCVDESRGCGDHGPWECAPYDGPLTK